MIDAHRCIAIKTYHTKWKSRADSNFSRSVGSSLELTQPPGNRPGENAIVTAADLAPAGDSPLLSPPYWPFRSAKVIWVRGAGHFRTKTNEAYVAIGEYECPRERSFQETRNGYNWLDAAIAIDQIICNTGSQRGLGGPSVVHLEFLVVRREFHKCLTKRSWKLQPWLKNKLCKSRPVVHEVSV